MELFTFLKQFNFVTIEETNNNVIVDIRTHQVNKRYTLDRHNPEQKIVNLITNDCNNITNYNNTMNQIYYQKN